jgi:hypothetical protein
LNKNFGVERSTLNKKIQTENKIFPHKKETAPKASFKITWEYTQVVGTGVLF